MKVRLAFTDLMILRPLRSDPAHHVGFDPCRRIRNPTAAFDGMFPESEETMRAERAVVMAEAAGRVLQQGGRVVCDAMPRAYGQAMMYAAFGKGVLRN